MSNQTFGFVDVHGDGVLNIFDAQCAINSMLNVGIADPSVDQHRYADVGHNFVDIDEYGEIVDDVELQTARIFPKRKVSVHNTGVDLRKIEEALIAFVSKVLRVVKLVLDKAFHNILHGLMVADNAVEQFATSLSVQKKNVPQGFEVEIPVEYAERVMADVAVSYHTRKVALSTVVSIEPDTKQHPKPMCFENVKKEQRVSKKKSVILQVLAILTAEILYGKNLSNIDNK